MKKFVYAIVAECLIELLYWALGQRRMSKNKAPKTERYFRVTLSQDQHVTIENAIRSLSAGDEDSMLENDDLLRAFLESTEEIQ